MHKPSPHVRPAGIFSYKPWFITAALNPRYPTWPWWGKSTLWRKSHVSFGVFNSSHSQHLKCDRRHDGTNNTKEILDGGHLSFPVTRQTLWVIYSFCCMQHTLSYSSKVLGSLIKTLTWHKKHWVHSPGRTERLYEKQHGRDILSNLALKAGVFFFPSKHFTQYNVYNSNLFKGSVGSMFIVFRCFGRFLQKYTWNIFYSAASSPPTQGQQLLQDTWWTL